MPMAPTTETTAPQTELVRKSFLTEVVSTVLILVGLLAFLAVFSFQEQAKGQAIQNIVGAFGHHSARTLLSAFGNAAYALGPYLMVIGILFLKRGCIEEPVLRAVAALVLLIALSVAFYLLQGVREENFASGGGVIGRRFGHALETSFGFYGALILSLGGLGTGALLATRLPATEFLHRIRDLFERQTLVVRRPRPPQAPTGQSPAAVERPATEHPAVVGAGAAALAGGAAVLAGGVAVSAAAPAGAASAAHDGLPPLVERASAETRPWFSRVDLPGPRDAQSLTPPPEAAPPVEAAASSRSSFAKPLEGMSRSASLLSMLRELGQRAQPPASADETAGEEPGATVLGGAFSPDGRRYLLRRSHAVLTPSATRFAAHAALPGGSGSVQTEPTPARASLRDGGPLLRPIQIRVHSESAGGKGRPGAPASAAGLRRPTLGLPEAAALSAPAEPFLSEEAFDGDMEPEELEMAAALDTSRESVGLQGDLSTEGLAETEIGEEELPEIEAMPQAAEQARDTAASLSESVERARQVSLHQAAPSEARSAVVPESGVPPLTLRRRPYRIPTEILNASHPSVRADHRAEVELTRRRLEQVLHDYGIQGKVVREQRGPIVTLFEIKLEPGVKVSRILGISDEIKMNLEAASVRILAPLPGRSTIGIEIPNQSRETVVLGDVIRRDETFFGGRRELTIVLGKDIAGNNQYVDLTTLPHLLMAGATGSGKSVYMNTVIASLLYTRSPEDVRFIMIDPKMVELTLFEGIPHLLMPVITDVQTASRALAWAVQEMERRYAMLSSLRCRDIRGYNERAAERGQRDKLPYLVVLIDELSDLMMVAAKDVEDSIIRLTQKARAVGIHVIMATQRPSVDVITALIKANCPARIAFQVAQRTDSRTILDANGAETLVGRGDMLYKSPSASGLRRVQALLITEDEIERIVAEARRFGEPNYVELPGESDAAREGDLFDGDADEDLFNEAWQVVLETGKTSTSYIQRRLRIGYNRAARLIEMMEERGYLGPAIGTRPREVLKRA